MTTAKDVNYWFASAAYDMKAADSMFKDRHYLWMAFLCHVIIEKMLKGFITKQTRKQPLRIHNLARLAELSGLDKILSDEQKKTLDRLEPLNIEGRYPSDKELVQKSLNKRACKKILT